MTIKEKKARKAAYMKKYWFRKKMSKKIKAWWAAKKKKAAVVSKRKASAPKLTKSESMKAYWAKKRSAAKVVENSGLTYAPAVNRTDLVTRLGNEMKRIIEIAVQEELRNMGLTKKQKYHRGFRWYARYEKIVPKRVLKTSMR